MKTKILYVIAALSIAMTSFVSLAVTANAAGDITATFNNGVLTVSGTGDMPDYSQVFSPWDNYKSSITSVVIESGITNIGPVAFNGCTTVSSVTIPNTVKLIDRWALSQCSFTSIDIPSSVTSIGYGAFQGCKSLTSVTIPEGVTTLGDYAFYGCSGLTSVTIPHTIQTIGDDAFESCSSLESIYYCGTEAEWNANVSQGSFWKPYKAQVIFIGAPQTPANNCGDNVTWTLENGTLTISGTGAMADYDNGNDAPWNNDSADITSVVIENGVTSIGKYAFYGCAALTSITIPTGVTSIGEYALSTCSNLTSIDIPNSVTSIGGYAFYSCSGLTSIEIPSSVTSIGEGAFSSCAGLTSITIPNSVTTIGNRVFSGCNRLTSIEIPQSVTTIGNEAFSACPSLTSITIPKSVTIIGTYAFDICRNLTSIYYNGTAQQWADVATGRDWKPNNAKVYVQGTNQISKDNLKAYTYSFFDVGATAFLASFTADDAHKLGDVTWYITSNGETRKTAPLSYGDLDVTSEPTEVVYVVTDLKDGDATAKATYEQAGYVEYK